jgi:hypothetical protein
MGDKENKGDSVILNYFESFKSYLNSIAKKDESKQEQSTLSLPPSLTREKIESEINDIISKESGMERVKELFKYEYIN